MRHHLTTQPQMHQPAHIARWPWHDPWGGAFMTHARAKMEADHARLLYAAAMMNRPEPKKVN
jgi:hypothetical protein